MMRWVIYDRPPGFPNTFVARLWSVSIEGQEPMGTLMVSPDIEGLRDQMRERGLVCVSRHPNDDPSIVEIWI